MESERTRKVRERAYHLWVESGHRDDHANQHWAQAEREVDGAGPKGAADPKAKSATAKDKASETAKASKDKASAKNVSSGKKADPKGAAKAEATPAKAGAKSAKARGTASP